MPSLGADMDKGTVVEWLKKPGDVVARGDILAVVETQKGAFEIEVFEEGVAGGDPRAVGSEVPVGTVLARIQATGAQPTEPAPARPLAAAAAVPRARVAARRAGARARRRRRRADTAADLAPRLAPGGRARRRRAGPGRQRAAGRDHAGRRRGAAQAAGRAAASARQRRGFDPAAMRQAIATAMARSKREIPHYYLSQAIDLGRSMDWLAAENGRREVDKRLLPAALLLKAVALALRDVPQLNGFWIDGAPKLVTADPCRLDDLAARRRAAGAGHPRRRQPHASTRPWRRCATWSCGHERRASAARR